MKKNGDGNPTISQPIPSSLVRNPWDSMGVIPATHREEGGWVAEATRTSGSQGGTGAKVRRWRCLAGKSSLVGGLEHVFFLSCFPYIGKNHPNWTFIFFRGVETTNQPKNGWFKSIRYDLMGKQWKRIAEWRIYFRVNRHRCGKVMNGFPLTDLQMAGVPHFFCMFKGYLLIPEITDLHHLYGIFRRINGDSCVGWCWFYLVKSPSLLTSKGLTLW